jgi:glycosyltransferase involved in cell wall biosynthesis
MVHPKAKIKIVFVITGTGVGGAEKILYHTSTLLDRARYVPYICSLKEKGAIARNVETAGIEVHSLTMTDGDQFGGWFASLAALFRLTRYVMKVKPAIVHSFLFRANILARIAASLARVPLVISSVRVMGGEKTYYHTIEKITSFMVNHYITVSESVKAHLVRTAGIPERKITTIYNGIALNDHSAASHAEQQPPSGLKADDRLVLTVGRLHRQKGYDVLIRAFAQVRKEYSTLQLLIIGEGEEENSLKNLAKSLDLTDQVIFAGLRLDSDRIFPLAELFVLPSLWEGMPNAVLEAMAAGKPVVATDVGGVPELVLHGETGLLVPPGDPDALARAILDLCADPVKAHTMGEAGRVRVHEHFRIAAMIEKTDGLYQKLLATKRPL